MVKTGNPFLVAAELENTYYDYGIIHSESVVACH